MALCPGFSVVKFTDSGVDLSPDDEALVDDLAGPATTVDHVTSESVADGRGSNSSTLRRSARSAPIGKEASEGFRCHFRHHSYEPFAVKLLDHSGGADGCLRRDSLSRTTEVSSSSSFSIGSLSDYSTSLASVSDESQLQSWCSNGSKHSSLDRGSSCSEASATCDGTARSTVLTSLSNILPKNLFFRKTWNSGSALPSEQGSWKFFSRGSSSANYVPKNALILEDRPPNLPPKTVAEEQRQRKEYVQMLAKAKKMEEWEMKQRRRELKEQLKREERMSMLVKEWSQEVLPQWNKLKNSKRVNELWESGLPPCVRGRVWVLAIGNDLNITEDLFRICLSRAKDLLSHSSDSWGKVSGEADTEGRVAIECQNYESTIELIHLDVARTFPTLGIFQQGGPFYDLLFDMLSAYACYRPDIGYVQGMSFVAAVFLLNLDLFDAFVAFCNLLNNPVLLAFFRVQQSEMEKYFVAYELYFKHCLPKLHAHFTSLEVKPNLYLIDWLYTLFARSLPLEITCRVWDLFLRDGDSYLFDTALGLLSQYESVLLTMDFDRVVEFLTRLPEKMDADELLKRIRHIRSRVDRDRFFIFK